MRAIVDSTVVSYERLPMLEIVFDRLVRLMTTSLRNFTSDNVEVSLDRITSVRFGDYMNSIPLPAVLSVFKAEEWENFGLATVDSSLIYSIIDVLLGGRRVSGVQTVLDALPEAPLVSMVPVGLDANGRVQKGAAQTGVIGVLLLTQPTAAGKMVDVMQDGEVVDSATTGSAVRATRSAIARSKCRSANPPATAATSAGGAPTATGQVVSIGKRLSDKLLVTYEHGLGTIEDIDKGMELGCGHPMGPLKLTDHVGLDIRLDIAEYLYKYTVDKNNYVTVYDAFSYSSSRDELSRFIQQYR